MNLNRIHHSYLLADVNVCFEDVNHSVMTTANITPAVRMPNTLPIRKVDNEVQHLGCSLEDTFLKYNIVNRTHARRSTTYFSSLLISLVIQLRSIIDIGTTALVGDDFYRVRSVAALFTALCISLHVRQDS